MITLLIVLASAVLGAGTGGLATYFATRSTMRLKLEHTYDRALRDKRLECYQDLFRVTRRLPRYWLPGEAPTIEDLRAFRENFHDWYFGDKAGGMFLTPLAKDAYMRMMNTLVERIHDGNDSAESSA